jgi:hypothetical protein
MRIVPSNLPKTKCGMRAMEYAQRVGALERHGWMAKRTTEFSAADKDGFASEVLNELPFVRNLTNSADNVRKWSAKKH